MILQTRRWLPNRELVVVADSAFSALEWLHTLVRQNITVITRLRLDAALYQPAPSVTRAPTAVLAKSANVYRRCGRFSYISRHDGNASPCRTGMGESSRVIELCTNTAVWYHTGLPPVPIRWVLIRVSILLDRVLTQV
jgi:hypothetical protein